MREQLAYYGEILYGYYIRNLRHLKWQGRYYILPAYRKLLGRHRERWIEFGPNVRRRPRFVHLAALGGLLIAGTASIAVLMSDKQPTGNTPPGSRPTQGVVSSAHSENTPPPAPAATAKPESKPGKLLFGLGAQADGAMNQKLTKESPVGMLSSWFNSPDDLRFMRSWRNTTVQQAYVNGKALHLIVWTGGEEKPVRTAYGPACGRAYPFSASFEADMRELATIFAGRADGPPLYVSMFTEFQTYPCQDNTWRGSETYYRGLQERYRKAYAIFKETAPNAQVSLTWGGWQADWDDPAKGGGKSLIPHFADVMRQSDFQSFQAMDSRSNVQHIADMTRILGGYSRDGQPRVMVAHFKPDNRNQQTWSNDLATIFTAPILSQLQDNGLFAFSFMDETNVNASSDSFRQAGDIVRQYGR